MRNGFVERFVGMKRTILACLAGMTVVSSQAQFLNPDSIGGAAMGAFWGGILGGDCHHGFSGEAAAIGAGIGFLTGTLVNESRKREYEHYSSQPAVYVPQPSVSLGYGYGPEVAPTYVYYAPNNYLAPGYYYQPTRPNYAVGGTLAGAASGALIGAGYHDAGKGAAIGAAAGLVLGTAAELSTRHQEKKYAERTVQTTEQVQTTSHGSAQQQPYMMNQQGSNDQIAPAIDESQRNQVTSKPCPTSTYHWTPRPQIADAPRVPDAPTF